MCLNARSEREKGRAALPTGSKGGEASVNGTSANGVHKNGAASGATRPCSGDAKRITLPSLVILVYVSLAFLPRLALYGCIFVVGQLCRAVAKVVCHSVGAPHAANKRVLIISDYMPPQCHGIALRVSEYTRHLRAAGHEVHVYTCCVESRVRTSFDHPTLPFVLNPFNSGNQISYSVGVKLAWALGAESWDVVHLFYPNMLGLFVLPACRWRGIASYCSHHVDMDYYCRKYVEVDGWPVVQRLARLVVGCLYDVCYRLPATFWGDVNASMTKVFVEAHLPLAGKHSHVATIGSGVDAKRFFRKRPADQAAEREALLQRLGGASSSTKPPRRIWLMVQRLAPEKDTHVALEALALVAARGADDGTVLVVAGDGPARESLERRAEALFGTATSHRVHFLGAVPNADLGALYRAADVFVTCSRSETFGLTVTEALACGACVALPRCSVFDELYGRVLPADWRFDADDQRGAPAALVEAAEAAASAESRAWLAEHPVEVSWVAASRNLDQQYTLAVKRGRTKYSTYRQFLQKRLIHLGRASLLAVSLYYVLSFYYRKVFCTDDFLYFCHAFFPAVPRPVRVVAVFTSIIALEWAHC